MGRDFKLYGYAAIDNKPHFMPLTTIVRTSFTHTDADQPLGAADGFDVNDNFAFDGMTMALAGRMAKNLGGIVRFGYNGISQAWSWGGFNLRYAEDAKWNDTDLVWGISLNNGPGRSDVFEMTNAGAPTVSSGLVTRGRSSPIQSSLSGIVMGLSAYMRIEESLYAEFSLYDGLNRDTLNALGVNPLNSTHSIAGLVPYGRLVLEREYDFGAHVVALGVSALRAETYPRDIQTFGTNVYTNTGVDAHYQWFADPASTTSDMVGVRVAYLRENADLDASKAVLGWNSADRLDVFRTDVTYSMDATLTGMLQYAETSGTRDQKRWSGTGNVDTRSFTVQLDYVPWGKPDASIGPANMRLSVQYTAFAELNGRTDIASDKNTLLVSLTLAGSVEPW